mmetsp:Transcript_21808/g.49607  ORF Transcript_21808/g.49607 Transcript_21808/m.49607 type:complete len:205 (-) Transcript_21808:90-704(-)
MVPRVPVRFEVVHDHQRVPSLGFPAGNSLSRGHGCRGHGHALSGGRGGGGGGGGDHQAGAGEDSGGFEPREGRGAGDVRGSRVGVETGSSRGQAGLEFEGVAGEGLHRAVAVFADDEDVLSASHGGEGVYHGHSRQHGRVDQSYFGHSRDLAKDSRSVARRGRRRRWRKDGARGFVHPYHVSEVVRGHHDSVRRRLRRLGLLPP